MNASKHNIKHVILSEDLDSATFRYYKFSFRARFQRNAICITNFIENFEQAL